MMSPQGSAVQTHVYTRWRNVGVHTHVQKLTLHILVLVKTCRFTYDNTGFNELSEERSDKYKQGTVVVLTYCTCVIVCCSLHHK